MLSSHIACDTTLNFEFFSFLFLLWKELLLLFMLSYFNRSSSEFNVYENDWKWLKWVKIGNINIVLYKIVYISLSWFHSFFFIFKENVERFLQQLPPCLWNAMLCLINSSQIPAAACACVVGFKSVSLSSAHFFFKHLKFPSSFLSASQVSVGIGSLMKCCSNRLTHICIS